jgi:hypothetical protein
MNDHKKAELVSAVERIGAALQQAREDVALLQRLKTAEENAERLATELRAAQDELAEVMAADFKAKQEARYAGFLDITVTEHTPHNATGVLQMVFKTAVTRETFNGYENVPEVRTYTGFQQLPNEAFGYLIERHPERIPDSIKALAPNDPAEAFDIYFMGLQRGYLTARAA